MNAIFGLVCEISGEVPPLFNFPGWVGGPGAVLHEMSTCIIYNFPRDTLTTVKRNG